MIMQWYMIHRLFYRKSHHVFSFDVQYHVFTFSWHLIRLKLRWFQPSQALFQHPLAWPHTLYSTHTK